MPLPVVSIEQMREWERSTWATGQTETEVIRRVGLAIGRAAMSLTSPGDGVLILAGKGNNGADARQAVPHIADRRVDLLEVTDPANDLPKLQNLLASKAYLVIDGLFGIGINRALSPDWVRFIDAVNQAGLSVLSVDVPSGIDANTGVPQGTAIRASVTLTVGGPKTGLLLEPAWPYVGRLEVTGDVGLVGCPVSSDLLWTLSSDFQNYPPGREAFSHKGTYGHLAVIAGSVGYHGAAVLAARGAQRAQPGLITLFTPEAVYHPVAAQLQAVMVSPFKGELDMAGPYDAVMAGPGLAHPEMAQRLSENLRTLWEEFPGPVIIDASALAWLAPRPLRNGSIRVITPHPGEAARLLGVSVPQVQSNRLAAVRELSRRFGGAWVVLKGQQSLIGRAEGEVFVNSSGNPHMAQGGSGDVLAGFLGGFLAQPRLNQDPLKAIRYAVWEHGAAADRLQKTRSGWVVEELMDSLKFASFPSGFLL